jgi:Tfp pilus assembly protein PilO
MMTGKRAPLIAGAVMAVIAILAFLLLVNPKRAEVSAAQTALDDAQSQEGTLNSQLGSLKDAEAAAPENRKIIRQAEQQVPPTADPQGFILLLSKAATTSGCDLSTTNVGTPTADPTLGFSVIPISLTLSGGYFSLDQFLFQIETLPRAGKVLNITLAPEGEAGTAFGSLTMQVSMELYTTDQSAGPASDPGPTEGETGTTTVIAPVPTG